MNKTLLTDFYQINMMYSHFKNGKINQETVFDLYFRKNPGQSGYAIAAGLEQAVDYIVNLKFSDDDLQYLRSVGSYDDDFLNYLKSFRFTGELYAVPEGTVVFPHEPLIRVKAPIGQAQLIETALLNIVNHQTLIATKAARIMEAAGERMVMEFGLRRAQGSDAGLYGARAAYIGGVQATSNVLAGQMFGIPVKGTHSHAFVQSYPSEYEAFLRFCTHFS